MLRRRILYRKKSEITPAYSADNLVFTGSNYVDTGIKLCDYKKDWTLFICYTDLLSSTGYNAIFHCIHESNPYNGVAFDLGHIQGRLNGGMVWTAVEDYLTINVHNSSIYNVKHCMCYKRSGDSFKLFSDDKYPNGYQLPTPLGYNQYISENLLLGCYQTTTGTKGRYWKGTIHQARIYLSALTDAQIIQLINNAMS